MRIEELSAADRIAMDFNLSQVMLKLTKQGIPITSQRMALEPECGYIPSAVDAWLIWKEKQVNQGEFQEKLLSVLERIAVALEGPEPEERAKRYH